MSRLSRVRSFKAFLILLGVGFTIVGLGQACGPAFTPMSNDLSSASGFLSEEERKACESTAPKPTVNSISTLVQYINGLPRPVQIHCLLVELPRPLYVQAGASSASAQPSPGTRDPRIFIRLQNMILAVVPDGSAKNTLEVSQLESGTKWERAEFVFPISQAQISERAGLDHIRFGAGTTCGLCHQAESGSRTLDGSPVFKSDILRFATSERVSIEALRTEAVLCRTNDDKSDRCLLFRSLFDGGRVLSTEI